MFVELYEMIVETDVKQSEKLDFFLERTQDHIQRVQNAAQAIATEYPEFEAVVKQAEEHDASKYEEPEKDAYVELTWLKKQDQKADGEDNDQINQATLHHVKNNSHHPEYHLEDKSEANINADDRDKSDDVVDATRMPDLDIAEMIADWQAMSEELGTNTAREWFDSVRDVRWHFSAEQESLIDKLLKVFEKD